MGVTSRGYHFPEPTDLVTDGATAIETLAGDVNADIVALAAALAAGDALAIAKALVDAKGDLIVATADNTPARLAVGTNGQILTADNTQATGVKWATPSAGGSMINQTIRGTITMAATGVGSATATIASVNTAKTQLRYLGWRSSGTAASTANMDCLVKLASATQVTAERMGGTTFSGPTIDAVVSYEVTEWT